MNESPDQTQSAAADYPLLSTSSSEEIAGDLYCPKCGYNLRGLQSDRCPECGFDISIVRDRESQLPWVRRPELGLFRAYWKTVWMVIFRSEQFGLEICRPVDERAARRFRLATMLYAYLPFVLLTLIWRLAAASFAKPVIDFAGYGLVGAVHVGVLACIALITAVPYYALYHRDVPLVKRHRAAVLSFYSCAPLAWVFLSVLLGVTGVALTALIDEDFGPPLSAVGFYMAAVGVFLAILVAMMSDLRRNVRRVLRDSGPVWWITLKLIVLWFLGGLVTLIGIPFAYLFLAVVFHSLT